MTTTVNQDLHVTDELQIGDSNDGEVQGDKMITVFSREVATVGGANLFVGGDGVQTGNSRGVSANRAGSITGLSMCYEVISVTSAPTMTAVAVINGVDIFTVAMTGTTVGIHYVRGIQARDIDNFTQEQPIHVRFTKVGGTLTTANMISVLEFHLDA